MNIFKKYQEKKIAQENIARAEQESRIQRLQILEASLTTESKLHIPHPIQNAKVKKVIKSLREEIEKHEKEINRKNGGKKCYAIGMAAIVFLSFGLLLNNNAGRKASISDAVNIKIQTDADSAASVSELERTLLLDDEESVEKADEDVTDTSKTSNEVVAEEKNEPSIEDYTFTEISGIKYAIIDGHVKSMPGMYGKNIGSLEKNAEVIVTGQCNENDWYRIEYKGKTAYCRDIYLVDEIAKVEETSAEQKESIVVQDDTDNSNNAETVTYVLNTRSKKYHIISCASVKEILVKNRFDYSGTWDKFCEEYSVYSPCQNCHPKPISSDSNNAIKEQPELLDEETVERSAEKNELILLVVNTNTKKYHKTTCRHIEEIYPENREDFSGTWEKFCEDYSICSPCGTCKPRAIPR